MSIAVQNIGKTFGHFTALNDVSFEVSTGELVALLGSSGSGKTTLLRIIAGLEAADQGRVLFHGEDATQRSVGERQVGFVFQHYALFRHMTVFENVAFGLRVRPRRVRPSEQEIRATVRDLLKMVQLEQMAERYPSQLSGGQRQRVALARALAVQPRVLLLDEPFGALDAQVRKELRRWLRRLHDEMHVTSVFVTHDQEEALEVADRVVIMDHGAVEQIGSPEDVYDHPATPFVYQFLGNVNLFHGRMHEGNARIGDVEVETPEHANAHDVPAVGYVRPHDIDVTRHLNGTAAIEAVVTQVHPIGPLVQVELARKDTGDVIAVDLTKERHQELQLQEGERVYVTPRNVKVFVHEI
jgi:sulfate/thiosulfate transport system ATP-binding protein